MSGGLYRSGNSVGRGPGSDWYGETGDRHGAVDDNYGTYQTLVPQPVEEPAGPGAGEDPQSSGAAASSAVMAIGSLVSRGTGFMRTAAVAAALGGGLVANAYNTAQFFPGMIYELLLGGILSSVLIPVLVRRRKTDPDGGEEYSQRLLSLAVLALAAATLLAVLAAPLLTMLYAGGDTTADFRGLVTKLAYLLLPIIFFSGVSALLSAILNTRGHFAAPMWAPILNNLVVMAAAGVFLVLFGSDRIEPDQMGAGHILVIGGGTLLGMAIQVAGLWPALRKVNFRWRWRGQFRRLGLRELGRLGGWMFCYVGISQVGVLVLLYVLNQASAGGEAAGVAIYNYVYLLLMMAHGIVAVSIITALMPRMSASAADGRYSDLADDLARGTRTSIAVLAPISVVYAVLALPIVVTLFERGNFTRVDSERAGPVLLLAAVALVPFAISQLFTFSYYAMADTKTPALINIPVVVVRVVVQVGLFLIFSKSFVASGLMIGNAVSYVVAAVLSAWLLRPRVGAIGLGQIAATSVRVLVASLGAGLAGFVVVRLLPGGSDPSYWQAVVQVTVGGMVIGLGYLGLAVVLRIREINEVLGLVLRKVGR